MSAWMWIPIGLALVVFILGGMIVTDQVKHNKTVKERRAAREARGGSRYDSYYDHSRLEYPGSTVFGTLVIAFVVFFVGAFVTASFIRDDAEVSRGSVNLAALSDDTRTTGQFFLGSGTIDSVSTYTFIKKLNDGGYKMGHIDTANATVYESKSTPHIDYITHCTPEGFWPAQCDFQYTYRVYIPEGSIWQGYDVDVRGGN